jgi:pantetheine-phosphate adenylyltransferase
MTERRVAVAGTFGPLHDGHRNLLRTALKYADGGVVVGLSTDAFARSRRTRAVPDYEDRKAGLATATAAVEEWDRDVDIRPLSTEHGIASDDPAIDALTVSPETAHELADINELRRERGYDPLEGLVAPYVLAEDGDRISSTRIVHGEIDEHGAVLD